MSILNNENFEKYLGYLITGIVLPTIVVIMSHYIEYTYFQPQGSKTEAKVDSLNYQQANLTEKNDSIHVRSNLLIQKFENNIDKDTRIVKVLSYNNIKRGYSWVDKIIGFFFIIIPLMFGFMAIKVTVKFVEDNENTMTSYLLVIPFFILSFCFYFTLSWLLIYIFFYLSYFLLSLVSIELSFTPIVFALKTYECWLNYFLKLFS